MSKHNKVNKSNYVQAGRLTPDEMGRERARQREHAKGVSTEPFKARAKDDDAPAPSPHRNEREE